ncbi:MAG: NAD(P)/FAD-dependent oxidoreductase [Parvularculaceae bacterium]
MKETADVVVIGAGVVGLAVGRALAKAGREVVIVEQHNTFGTETSARNSEVIHAGVYYRPGGLRARLCVRGKTLLYDYCESRGVGFKRCEKLIVANGDEEVARLSGLKGKAERNGVDDLTRISGEEAARLEPGLTCDAALLSPSSGIVDSHGLMLALVGDLEEAGGTLALNAPVAGGSIGDGRAFIDIGGDAPLTLETRLVVNCAGLYAECVARAIKNIPPETIPTLRYAKGQYFTYAGRAPFSRLIYPMPAAPDSLGVHYTRDLGGQAKLGPDIQWDAALGDYSVDESRRDQFFEGARRFWPALERDRLQPGYAGLRAKISGPGEEGDFRIDGRSVHGRGAYIGLYGIESPGLTSCLAIGEHVAALRPS